MLAGLTPVFENNYHKCVNMVAILKDDSLSFTENQQQVFYFLFPVSEDESNADADLFCLSTTSLSFIPNLHSGIPDK